MRSNSDAVTPTGTAATPTRSCEGLDAGPAGPLPATFSATQCTLDTSVWERLTWRRRARRRDRPRRWPDRQLPAEAPGPIGEHLGGVGILAVPIVLAEAATLAESAWSRTATAAATASRSTTRTRRASRRASSPARSCRASRAPARTSWTSSIGHSPGATSWRSVRRSQIAADASVSVPRCARSIVIRGTEPWPSRYGDGGGAGGAAPRVFIRLAPPR